jgi:hypothetical protein
MLTLFVYVPIKTLPENNIYSGGTWSPIMRETGTSKYGPTSDTTPPSPYGDQNGLYEPV